MRLACRSVAVIAGLLLGGLVPQVAIAQSRTHELPEPPRPSWMSTDAALKIPISIQLSSSSLRTVCTALSTRTGISIRIERALEEQRVALNVVQEPLYKIMARLQDLFGHGKLPNDRYAWIRTNDPKTNSPEYMLARLSKAFEEEADILNWPQRRALQWAKEIRQYALLPPKQRKGFRSECRMLELLSKDGRSLMEGDIRPIAEAMAAITDQQLATLFASGSVELPQLSLSDEAIQLMRKFDPDSTDTTLPSHAELRLEQDSTLPGIDGVFTLRLYFHSGNPKSAPVGFGLDTLTQLHGDDDEFVDTGKDDQSAEVDLLAHEKAPPGALPKLNIAKALMLLVREAHLPLYAEIFQKPRQVLTVTHGKPEALLHSICNVFGYTYRKVHGDYLVYSKSWAQDRVEDVPQSLIDRWSAHYATAKRFSLTDFLEMVDLSNAQLKTLTAVFGIIGPFARDNRDALRLLNVLPKADIDAAFAATGTPLPLDNVNITLLQHMFGRDKIVPPVVVRLQVREYKGERIGVVIEFADQIGIAQKGGIEAETVRNQ
jgi:hypothetical protein